MEKDKIRLAENRLYIDVLLAEDNPGTQHLLGRFLRLDKSHRQQFKGAIVAYAHLSAENRAYIGSQGDTIILPGEFIPLYEGDTLDFPLIPYTLVITAKPILSQD